MSTAAMAICWKGWFTVVRSIWGRAEKEMLSKPISEMSLGMRIPASKAACMTPMASMSAAQRMAVS